ncbi:MAG: bi-domain-containing oxidoreductase [Deltaproteobacteria bacterium]|nr:bi-domain-containing oxidoreductase [Deltaproteobacteria bacterium]
MKQVIQSYKNGRIFLAEVPEPALKPGGLLVRTVASLISPGTEKLMLEMGRKSLLGKARARPDLVRQAWDKARREGFVNVFQEAWHRLDEPVPLGYSSAGVVLAIGDGVTEFRPGDRVAVAGPGYASHAEIVWAPEGACVPLPDGLEFEAGAFGTLGAIALHGVREAALTLGETVMVIGLGLLGLLSLQILKAQGCRVIGVDLEPNKVNLARELGADLALVPGRDRVEEAAANFTRGLGVDGVLITAASRDNRPLRLAETVARERARLVLVGVVNLSLTRQTFWTKELSFRVSRAAGPALHPGGGSLDYPPGRVRWTERRNLTAFLELVAQGRVRVDRLITHRFPMAEALRAYDLILGGKEPYIGVVLQYPPQPASPAASFPPTRSIRLKQAAPRAGAANRRQVGLIGGGLFAKSILMPAVKKIPAVKLAGVATTTGVSSRHLAQKFGFAYATTDYRQILEDPAIGSVLIATRHDSHGRLVVEALKAGKHVLVEKPLCLKEEELEAICRAYDGSRLLMVGFNRRFAPLTQRLKAFLKGRLSPLVMVYRVNAGYLPADSWVHDPRAGGGRLLGEVCHFIDFLQFICGAPPVRLSVTPLGASPGKYRPDDNLLLTLAFADGSIGSIVYTAKGSKAFSRERIEVFSEESVAVLEDFRRARFVKGRRTAKISRFSSDMGYVGELECFFSAPLDAPSLWERFEDYAASTHAALKAWEALKTGRTMEFSWQGRPSGGMGPTLLVEQEAGHDTARLP